MLQRLWIARVLVTALLATAFAGRAALAQDEEAGDDPAEYGAPSPERSYPIAIAKTDLTSFARWNGLSKEQRDAAMVLYTSYSERHAVAARKLWDYTEALSGGNRDLLWEDEALRARLNPVEIDYSRHLKKLKEEFLEGVRALLTPEQQSAREWLDQRMVYRENMQMLWAPGNLEIDLVLALEQVLPAEQTPDSARAVVSRHVARIASQIREALERMEVSRKQAEKLDELPAEDREAAMKNSTAWYEALLKDAHTESVDSLERIRKLLPEDQSLRLESRLYVLMAGGGYSIADRLIRRVERLATLNDEQRLQVAEVRRAYMKALAVELESLLKRIAAASDEQTSFCLRCRIESQGSWPILVAETEKVVARMREVLTIEQREAMGPPVFSAKLVIPDFDSLDEAPTSKPIPAMERHARRVAMQTQGPEVTELVLRRFGRSAKFTTEQTEAVNDLYADYIARFRAAAKKYIEFKATSDLVNMAEGQPEREDRKREIEALLKYGSHKDKLRDELISDIEALLTEEQRSSLDLLRAASKRNRGCDGWLVMSYPGAGVDLPMLVRSALRGREPSDELAAALDRYERDMVPSCNEILDLSRAMLDMTLEALEGEPDSAAQAVRRSEAEKGFDKPLEERREVSFKYFKQISPLMPEDAIDEFEESFYRAAGLGGFFELQLRGRSAGRSVRGLADEIFRLPDLSSGQIAALNTAMREHALAMRSISRSIYEQMLTMMGEVTEPNQRQFLYNDARVIQQANDRHTADTKMLERLMGILTPEQQNQLPMPYRPLGEVPRPNFEEE